MTVRAARVPRRPVAGLRQRQNPEGALRRNPVRLKPPRHLAGYLAESLAITLIFEVAKPLHLNLSNDANGLAYFSTLACAATVGHRRSLTRQCRARSQGPR